MHDSGSLAEFLADLRRALVIAVRRPWLPALDLALLIGFTASGELAARSPDEDEVAGLVFFLATVLYLALIGWLGVQRQVFRAAMVGEPLGLGDLPGLLGEQALRFLRLGFLLLPVAAVGLAILVSTSDLEAPALEPTTTGQLLILALTLALGVLLTAVTPTLALEVERARDAWNLGVERLRTNFRALRWHALVPPVFFAAAAAPVDVDERWFAVVNLAAGCTAFVFRGGAVAAYLRLRDRELALQA